MSLLLSVFLFSTLTIFALAAKEEDLITTLPGYDGELPFKMYSGYLPVGNISGSPGMIHYWFIEARKSPETAPVLYWTNGGPGGSGIGAGLLTEMGAIHIEKDLSSKAHSSTNNLKVVLNDYSWNNVANMLYVSQPKGVGYSYCLDESKPCSNDDQTSAQDAYDFFTAFYEHFPEYKKNDFYLTAESYGGIYIPTMLYEMDTRGGFPNLKGAAIGDGCWGSKVGMCAFDTAKSKQIRTEFFSGHAMISQTLKKEILHACDHFKSDAKANTTKCNEKMNELTAATGDFNIYNIYDTCGSNQMNSYEAHFGKNGQVEHTERSHGYGAALNDYPCGMQTAASEWLELPEVIKALHVDGSRKANFKYTWGPAHYSGDLRPLYKKLAEKYSILIYSGDVDGCVPFVGTEEWTRELGFPVTKAWKPWLSQHMGAGGKQRAGYVIEYEAGKDHPFWFATVQGAGHMVPTYKPHFALSLIEKFLKKDFE